jgi:hypothetical protein
VFFSRARGLPYLDGFFATAPASSTRWGDPGPLLARIVPLSHEFLRIQRTSIPYGETFAASLRGNLLVFCSPFSSLTCLLTNGFTNATRKLENPTDNLQLFGLGIAVSPNGSTIAIAARDIENRAVLQLFEANGRLVESFTIPHESPLSCRSKSPFLYFIDERNVVLGLPEISRVFIYRNSMNRWTLLRHAQMPFESISPFGQSQFVTITRHGRVQIFDKWFALRAEAIVSKTINDGQFVSVAGGGNWAAIIEEAANERKLHFYSTKGSVWWRGAIWFAVFLALALLMYYLSATYELGKLFTKAHRKKGQRWETKYV